MTGTIVYTAPRRRAVRARLATPARKVTMDEVMSLWLDSRRSQLKPTSLSTYRTYAKTQLRPALGGIAAAELTDAQVRELLTELSAPERGLARKTVLLVVNILKQVLIFGRDYGVTVDSAVCSGGAWPARQKTVTCLTHAEQERLVCTMGRCESALDIGVLLSLKTGLRVGEVAGLKWGDIDFSGGFLSVRRTVTRIYDEAGRSIVYVGEPKSDSSRRTVPLSPTLLYLLETRRRAADIYITSGERKPSEVASLQNHFKVLLRRAGIRELNFHALRHTFATRCVEKDFDVKSLSMILGHSDVSITMNTYVHPSMESLRSMMERV